MGPFARDARGEGISPVLMAVLGGGHKLLCSCHSESHPSASDTALCIRPVPLQQLHPPAAEPASHIRSIPLRWIHPFAPTPSFCLGPVPLHRILSQTGTASLSLHTTLLGVGDELWGPAWGICPLPSALSIPWSPTPASDPCTELGQFSCPRTSGRSTSWPASSKAMGNGMWGGGVPCRRGVPVWSHHPVGAEHPRGAPSHHPSLRAPVLAVSQPTPAELPKHRANGDKLGRESDFCERLFSSIKIHQPEKAAAAGGGGRGNPSDFTGDAAAPRAGAVFISPRFPAPHFMSAP